MDELIPTLSFTRGRLPHWLVAGKAYFVTLCRKGCLPAKVIADLQRERAELKIGSPGRPAVPGSDRDCAGTVARDVSDRAHVANERLIAQRQRFVRLEGILDAAVRGERDLCRSDVSPILLENFDWLRKRGWRIWAATIMPSHLHAVLSGNGGQGIELRNDLGKFMAYTARMVNTVRGLSGSFWQREPFDHWCRDGDAWLRSVSYTVNNPVKAGLCRSWRQWPYSAVDAEVENLLP